MPHSFAHLSMRSDLLIITLKNYNFRWYERDFMISWCLVFKAMKGCTRGYLNFEPGFELESETGFQPGFEIR